MPSCYADSASAAFRFISSWPRRIEHHCLWSATGMVRRFRLIDDAFRRLAPRYPNTIVIDRDSKEFHERQGLLDIIADAQLPMFTEIPYRVI